MQLVEQARRSGVRVVYISNNNEGWVRQAIEATGGRVPWPDDLVTADGPLGERRHAYKPAPDMLRHAMERHQISPFNTFVLGDRAEKDRVAALAAGIPIENVFIRPTPTLEKLLGPTELLSEPGTMRRFPRALLPQPQVFECRGCSIRVESLHAINARSPAEALRVIERCVNIQEKLSKKKKGRPFKPVTPEEVVREYGDDRRCLTVEAEVDGRSALWIVSRSGRPGTGKIVLGDVKPLMQLASRPGQALRVREVIRSMLRALGLHTIYIELEDGPAASFLLAYSLGARPIRQREEIEAVIRSFSKVEPCVRITNRLTGRYERSTTKSDVAPLSKYLYAYRMNDWSV